MEASLLITKLQIPVLRSRMVSRKALFLLLADARAQRHRLILTTGPAGFGKTTLMVEWLKTFQTPSAWINLDENDNDPTVFFALLLAALQQIKPEIGVLSSSFIHLPQLSDIQGLCIALLNEIATAQLDVTLVLDDYQLITNPAIHSAIAFMIERQPVSMQIVIITRESPPIPLARLRARNQLTEIDGNELRFSLGETTEFLLDTWQLSLPLADVEALHTRTEGWVTGLQLAVFAMRQSAKDPQVFIKSFTGRNRYIDDYLITEVIDRLPPEDRTFLRRTSVLEELNVSICNAVAQIENSGSILKRLEFANVFLMPLDDQGVWYHYHRMFAELLRSTLTPDESSQLHQYASRWYEEQGNLRQAIYHAFSACAWEDAALLIARCVKKLFTDGEFVTLNHWLSDLPQNIVSANFRLTVYQGLLSILKGDAVSAAEALERATLQSHRQQGNKAETDIDQIAYLMLQGYLALSAQNYEEVIRITRSALPLLSDHDKIWQMTTLWLMAEAYERAGDLQRSASTLQEARRLRDGLGLYAVLIDSLLASSLNELGQKREALQICKAALDELETQNMLLPQAALLYTRIALLMIESNQLDIARHNSEKLIAPLELMANDQLNSLALGIQARLLTIDGEYSKALDKLYAASALINAANLTDAGWIEAEIVNIRLKQGDTTFAFEWINKFQQTQDVLPTYLGIERFLSLVRCLIILDRFEEANTWLWRLEVATERMGLFRRRLTVHILQALVAGHLGERELVRSKLLSAIQFASDQDYVRAFLDEDPLLLTFLPKLRPVAPAFVDTVLNASRENDLYIKMTQQPLDEPLSEREIEVLRLIVAGLSNDEIASRLVIAHSTVKRHINHIYAKLEVKRRSQAIMRAQELGLM